MGGADSSWQRSAAHPRRDRPPSAAWREKLMAVLHVFLLGAPRVDSSDHSVALQRTKTLALLAYLAVTGRPQERDALCGLLWPEFDASSARSNLRRELSLLKTRLPDGAIVAEGRQVAYRPHAGVVVDVAVFQAHVATWRQHNHHDTALCAECEAALTTAALIYNGDFMAGFSVPDSPAFEEWQF